VPPPLFGTAPGFQFEVSLQFPVPPFQVESVCCASNGTANSPRSEKRDARTTVRPKVDRETEPELANWVPPSWGLDGTAPPQYVLFISQAIWRSFTTHCISLIRKGIFASGDRHHTSLYTYFGNWLANYGKLLHTFADCVSTHPTPLFEKFFVKRARAVSRFDHPRDTPSNNGFG
jgi:hypothetical protein